MTQIFGRNYDLSELQRRTGKLDQLFGVELLEYQDGPERGGRVLRFRTGAGFGFEVMVDRAMDLKGLEYAGIPIGWNSPTGFRHPWLHEHDSEDGAGWLRSFSGLVNTCGLDHIMGPAEESAEHYNYPFRSRVRHGLHGRIAYTPARLEGYGTRTDADGRTWLYAKGEIRQVTMFGENLVLHRLIEAEVGSSTVTISDRVTNEGFYATPHAMLYHVNLGFPVIDDRTRLLAAIRATPALFHDPKATSIGAIVQAPPQHRFREQVYEHTLSAEAGGTVPVALVNPDFAFHGAKGLGVLLEYDQRTLPAFYQWQNLQEGNYVVGIEPATAHNGTREERKARGEIAMLERGEARSYRIALTPLLGAEAIAGVERRIQKLG